MQIKFIEISGFRKLKSTRIDLDSKTTIFVGANNSGKTSAMVALRYFLLSPNRLSLRDITIANWTKLDELGYAWERGDDTTDDINDLLPFMDLWLDVPISEIQHVVHILPTLDWSGGLLGVRLKYRVKDTEKLKSNYVLHRTAARDATSKRIASSGVELSLWPKDLTDFMERRLKEYVELKSFTLDPSALVQPVHGLANPQNLSPDAVPLEVIPFKNLIKIDEIAAQRDFADAGARAIEEDDGSGHSHTRFKRRLSDQLRAYYDRHIDPTKAPSDKDHEAIGAIQNAERSFDERLKDGFASALKELEELGYPGVTSPKLKISTSLHTTDGLKHRSAVQYQVADPIGDGCKTLSLPEDYSGLGYQNLIAMVFMLMGFRDEWMRVGKLALDSTSKDHIQPLHVVLVEEPEAHLHAQVQQVFINKAYNLLRSHSELGDKRTFNTQLIISTHSSHVAHEADFANLRYFRRRPAANKRETPTTTVANLSCVFGDGDNTKRFVKRYLKSTHCDLFFADGIIFVEGSAERILIPQFIRHHFQDLSSRYVTILELGGSHAHRFRELVEELGLVTLIIADLDATSREMVTTKNEIESPRWKAARPQIGCDQKTSNPVLKEWHPKKELIDELVSLPKASRATSTSDGTDLYVTFQGPISQDADSPDFQVIPRTLEDALILENTDVMKSVCGSSTSDAIRLLAESNCSKEDLAEQIHFLLKKADKAAFALDCLMLDDPKSLKPPKYIREGLEWFQETIIREIAESDLEASNQ